MPAADPVRALAAHVAGVRPGAVPARVLEFQKRRLLDNVGTALAGAGQSGCAQLEQLLAEVGGVAEAQVIGSARRLPAAAAAQLNAVQARALDFCDVVFSGYHPSSTDVPVALAVGERVGASGLEVLAALAAGQDLAMRVNLAANGAGGGFHGFDGNILAVFGAAAVAGRLLGLDADRLVHAIGLAFNQAAGSLQSNQDKALGVRLIQGNAARAGVESALLAARGVTGPVNILSGECGFFALYARRPGDISRLLDGLGERWEGEAYTCFKPYPCCSLLLSIADAAAAVGARMPAGAALRAVELEISPFQQRVCGQPYAPGADPEVAAMFSAQYVFATTLRRGLPRLEHFNARAATEPAVVALAQSVLLRERPGFPRDHCRVHADWGTGTCEVEVPHGSGWPERPLDVAALRAKFADCAASSAAGIGPAHAASIRDAIERFETLESVCAFAPLLAPSDSPFRSPRGADAC